MTEKPVDKVDVTSIIGNPYNVIIFNDSVHSMEEVVTQLMKATGCDEMRAHQIMLGAHKTGRAIAYTGGRERCELVESILAEIKLMTKIEQA
jgi:ATP-dependent Clp protease adapter protein ClpS